MMNKNFLKRIQLLEEQYREVKPLGIIIVSGDEEYELMKAKYTPEQWRTAHVIKIISVDERKN